VPRNLVAAVAERLMEATASTAAPVSEQVLAQLVEHYNADASFLRRNEGERMRRRIIRRQGRRRWGAANPHP
jgi:diguanylate cyclase